MMRGSALFFDRMRWACIAFCALPAAAVSDVIAPDGRVIECYCTDSTGDRVELGETICLHVNGRMFMAQCQMSLNNPMWREVQDGCATSALPQSVREAG